MIKEEIVFAYASRAEAITLANDMQCTEGYEPIVQSIMIGLNYAFYLLTDQ
jgi:hypothetical protein